MNKLPLVILFVVTSSLSYGQNTRIGDTLIANIDVEILLAITPNNDRETYLQLDIGEGMQQVLSGNHEKYRHNVKIYKSEAHALNEVAKLGYEIKLTYKNELDHDVFVFVRKE